ncbi:type I polyketide synthase [Spirosoma montaniterrae]|uniref:Peptide synthetase n=1 Tax=Spirosoma montaniterrae TaxID=1178516 RepID=A0A1P9WZI3_9BACT|nr:type I polyketide synthase [Spirosoma montaniterrae]AQG80772.1 peptide synthetase [Spirosoma montaniterrae]
MHTSFQRSDLFVHQLVEEAVQANPEQIAVVFNEQTLTYRQLNEQADQLSQVINSVNSSAERIGISTTRGVEMVVGLLAILKAGKAYLPLDPAYPTQRLQEIISDSGLQTVVAAGSDATLFAELGLRIVDPSQRAKETPENVTVQQGSAAYVLYTSGSTGTPKGVSMGHAPLVNLLNWQRTQSVAGPATRTLQLAPLSFDVSFQEIFATLTTGGTLLLIDETLRLDLAALLSFIDKQGINRLFLPFVALQYLAEIAVTTNRFPSALREVMTAGEQLKITPQVAAFFAALPGCTLFNQYGPTECHVVTQLALTGDPATWPALPNIGKPIDNVTLYVLGETGAVLPDSETGELCFGGACVAEGYVNRPELTNEKFITLTLPNGLTERVYRTGDLGRRLPNGEIDFLGRRDDQVKIRGHRVELGEIEVVINRVQTIRQAVVVAREGADGQKRLIAYVVSASGHPDEIAVRRAVADQLPEFMMPSAFIWLSDLPKTTSGKVDRKKLPDPKRTRPASLGAYRKPRTDAERAITTIWTDLLQLDRVGTDDNFFELGGNSLLAQKTVAALLQRGYTLPITKLYQFPTAAGVANYVTRAVGVPMETRDVNIEATTNPSRVSTRVADDTDIAIIGMAGRFPGADSVDELWSILKDGRETVRFFSDTELDTTIPDSQRQDPLYVRARGVLNNADQFDAAFFGLTPTLAQLMDPQQRLFLEIAWETLEQTGYLTPKNTTQIGVFAGCGNNTYYLNNVRTRPDLIEQVGAFQVMSLNEKDYIASRTAYQLNLNGPAVSVYSACSTSLLAIAQAVQSLRSGQCELALAGGASLTAPINSGHTYQEGTMYSRDGHTRSFDADATGTVFSDGAGVVLLKPAAAARRDGDTIYAVIKGVGVNNDGGGKGSFMAPNAEGQAGAIRMALADAQVDPASISYVEAHGTATPLGDPIEVEGLTMAFGEQAEKQFCAIGSIKSNLGHLTQAAGVAGIIKTVLALQHRQLPASVGFSRPNPSIDFANSPFFVNTELTSWTSTSEEPRRAGVSSFGVGGTNVHVVLEEAGAVGPVTTESTRSRPLQLISWSAKTATSCDAYAQKLARFLQKQPSVALADVAYTLQTTRRNFQYRRFAIADSTEQLQAQLTANAASAPVDAPGETAFLFPGQGSQFVGMGKVLYDHETVFRQAIDTCAELLTDYIDLDIRQILYAAPGDAKAEQRLNNTRYTQPALFVTEYALAKLWMSWGIEPTLLCGHSVGEFVAAHLAGVFSLPDALRLVATRGRLISELPRGSMLSVRLNVDTVRSLLPDTLSIAALNSRNLCVVAGADEDIADFARLLDERDIPNRILATSHAFHSAMMDPVLTPFAELVGTITLHRPQKPIVSTLTGGYLTDAQATDPQYWARHLRETVRFADALDTIFATDNPILLEVGPGKAATTFARQQTTRKTTVILPGLDNQTDRLLVYQSVLTTLGQLWQAGLQPDWTSFYGEQLRTRIALPTYAFDRKRCWIEAAQPESVAIESIQAPAMPHQTNLITTQPYTPVMRIETLINRINELLEDASGLDMAGVDATLSFLEIGLDSLLLTQVAITLKNEFGVPITFRQLTSEFDTPARLAAHLDQVLPADAYRPATAPVNTPVAPALNGQAVLAQPLPTTPNPAIDLIAQQLHLLAQQVALLQGNSQPTPAPVTQSTKQPDKPASVVSVKMPDLTPEEEVELKKPFGATARIERQASGLTAKQADFLADLTERYNRKTARSKAYAQQHRAQMADPRVVTGFRPLTKEIVYPLVVNRSKGSRLWDIDGNEYIDALNGFGSNMLGYQPDLIKQALHDQIENGFEVGPQHELAGEVCQMICQLTGADRAALCSTGSEAVLGTMRIARTITGRSLIVAFTGSYHGINDEVLVRGTKKLKSFPAAPGIMPEAVQNMLILEYGTDESLRIIRERAHELAAVLVEPVQSRRPEFVPVEFLKKVRAITAASGTALIFDEVITGFRSHPGGAQALFGIRADLASYGKVVGAGIPIGVIAGKREFMDALDGGFWQYGDASVPEIGVTYFAGTFVRHPLALAAAKASLTYMLEQGPSLQEKLTQKAAYLANALNAIAEKRQLPLFAAQFGSLWKLKFKEELQYGELIFTLMREKGIHVWDGFPCFITEAHTNDEINTIISYFADSFDELIDAGFLPALSKPIAKTAENGLFFAPDAPPVSGARLGRDPNGKPAWFIENPDLPGKFLQVDLTTDDGTHYQPNPYSG